MSFVYLTRRMCKPERLILDSASWHSQGRERLEHLRELMRCHFRRTQNNSVGHFSWDIQCV